MTGTLWTGNPVTVNDSKLFVMEPNLVRACACVCASASRTSRASCTRSESLIPHPTPSPSPPLPPCRCIAVMAKANVLREPNATVTVHACGIKAKTRDIDSFPPFAEVRCCCVSLLRTHMRVHVCVCLCACVHALVCVCVCVHAFACVCEHVCVSASTAFYFVTGAHPFCSAAMPAHTR